MDTVEIMLSFVVGFTVLVCLVLESIERRTESDDSESKEGDASPSGCPNIIGNDEDAEICKKRGVISDEFTDDWVQIERTELDRVFGAAIAFVSSGNYCNDRIEDVKLQLSGLQELALRGCHQPQPMGFGASARTKWSADMSREMGMERYINILSEAIPQWKDLTCTSQDNE